jgi:hypothetical protein
VDGQGTHVGRCAFPPTLDTRHTDALCGPPQDRGLAPCPLNWTSGAVGRSDSLFPPPPRGRVQDFLDQVRSWETLSTLNYPVAPKWSISMPLRAISRSECLANPRCALDCDLTPLFACRAPSSSSSPFATHSPLQLPDTPPPTTSTGPTHRLQWRQALLFGQPSAARQRLGRPHRSRHPQQRGHLLHALAFCVHLRGSPSSLSWRWRWALERESVAGRVGREQSRLSPTRRPHPFRPPSLPPLSTTTQSSIL